jgi:soluble lytic murein transglycosylase-like protein
MAYSKIYVKLPDIRTSFKAGTYDYSTPSVKAANIKMIQKINSTYGQVIQKWAELYEIPVGVIISFIATESGGTMAPPNKYQATGLMQVTPTAIYEVARKWSSEVDSPLPQESINVLNQRVPDLLKSKTFTAGIKNSILSNLQRDANFNIMAGTMILRWLLERFSTLLAGGQLNKAMVAYNAGAYNKAISSGTNAITTPVDSTTLSQMSNVPAESRGYLLKMLGKDGFLELIYKDKAI